MRCVRTRILLMVGVLLLAASCGSMAALSDDELATCTISASSEGTIGGSSNLVSMLVVRLPDDAVSSPDALRVAFNEEYGITVDEFLLLRGDADAVATVEFGEPPSVGERVSNEWFIQRDVVLMQLWNDRHPASARTLCDSLMGDVGKTP